MSTASKLIPDLQSIFDLISGQDMPMTVPEVCRHTAVVGSVNTETVRQRLQALVRLGWLERSGHYPVRYTVASRVPVHLDAEPVTRAAVRDTSRPDWLTDQVIAAEVEAEKVWTLAGVLRAANTAWGIDMGIDADVREARALMEEARRQIRDNTPIGQHHREHELPFSGVPAGGPLAGAQQREAAE